MRKAFGNKYLAMILLRQFHGYVLTVGRTVLTDIDCHIQHDTLDTTDQLTLGKGRALEMQSPHHPVGRLALVILDKSDLAHFLIKFPLGERLEEIAPRILKDPRFNHHNTINSCFYYFHKKDPDFRIDTIFQVQIYDYFWNKPRKTAKFAEIKQ